MAYPPPTFNLTVSLWRAPALFAGAATRIFAANLAIGRRTHFAFTPGTAVLAGSGWLMDLLCPARTDIAGVVGLAATDIVEAPSGSGRVYVVTWVDDVGRGFSNEYRLAKLRQLTANTLAQFGNPWLAPMWPVPAP